jgi:glucose/mannose transport system permease protein
VVRLKVKSRTLTVLVIVTLISLTIAYLLPVYVVLVTSLKTPFEISHRQYLLPSGNLQFKNYAQSFKLIVPALLNSAIITLSVTALCALLGGLGGYYLSRTRTRFTKILFILVGIAMYLPYQVILIPLVQLISKSGLALTHFGLIGSNLILNIPFAAVLMGTFFMGIPRELEEAAEVDGASRIHTFFRVISPVAKPAYVSVVIIIFTQVWNEFLLALTLVTPRTRTIQLALTEIKGTFVALYNLQMAAALITLVVPLVFFLLLSKYFVKGILAGALKG